MTVLTKFQFACSSMSVLLAEGEKGVVLVVRD